MSAVVRYVTVGGATVDVARIRFTTRYTTQGRPYVSNEPREVDGFTWACQGCGKKGGVKPFGEPYLPNEQGQANDDANGHAETCRALPRPDGA